MNCSLCWLRYDYVTVSANPKIRLLFNRRQYHPNTIEIGSMLSRPDNNIEQADLSCQDDANYIPTRAAEQRYDDPIFLIVFLDDIRQIYSFHFSETKNVA